MPRRSVSWLLVLLALPTTALLALGLATASGLAATAPLFCLYLPVVGSAGPGQGAAPATPGGACPERPNPTLPTLRGKVRLRPEHGVWGTLRTPIQYVVVLDQSGSMSANFKGQCDTSTGGGSPPARNFPGEPAAFWQCANGPLYDSDGDGFGDTVVTERVSGVGPVYYWANRDERRITVAKQAVETLIGLTNMPGNTGYAADQPDDQMALVWFNERALHDGNSEVFANGQHFTNQSQELVTKLWARTTGPDSYRTAGGTNATAGLYRAGLLLDAAPTRVVSRGLTYNYRRVVVLITDGVTNQFFHESQPDLQVGPSDASTYPNGHSCRALGPLLAEDADCQTTAVGGVYPTTINGDPVNLDRPMTQLVKSSQDYLQRNGALVTVVALSNLQASIFSDGVASFPNYFYRAPNLVRNGDGSTNVDQIMKELPRADVERTCHLEAAPEYVGTMGAANRPQHIPLTFPNVGTVTLKHAQTEALYSAPIVAAADGSLSYTVTGLPEGTYTLSAVLFYRGADEATRGYEFIDLQGQLVPSIIVDVTGSGELRLDLDLRLKGNVSPQLRPGPHSQPRGCWEGLPY